MSSISFNLFILVNILIIPMLILSETNQYKLHFFPFNLIKHVIYFLAYSIYLCSCRIEKQPADDILHPALVSLYNVGLDYPGVAFLLVLAYTAMFVCMAYLVSRLRKVIKVLNYALHLNFRKYFYPVRIRAEKCILAKKRLA